MQKLSRKQCSTCKEYKDYNEFNKDKNRPDGHYPECKTCRKKSSRKYYEKYQEQLKAKSRRNHWEYIEKIKARKKVYREKHKEEINQKGRSYFYANQEQLNRKRREFRIKNIEREKAKQKKIYQQNPEWYRFKSKEYYRKNKERASAQRKNYHQTPHGQEVRRKAHQARRARKRGNGGSYTVQEWQDLLTHYNNTCLCCGIKGEDTELGRLTPDHVIPLAKGGTSNIDNIQPLCYRCNISKKDKIIDYRPNSHQP